MTKYLQSCYEWLHTLGPYPRIVKCPYCNRNEWRGDLTVDFIKRNGCILCRCKQRHIDLVKVEIVDVVPRVKCSGRYDGLEDIPLNISPVGKNKKSLKIKNKTNSSGFGSFLSGFNKKSFTKIHDSSIINKNVKISDNRMRHYQNIDYLENQTNDKLNVKTQKLNVKSNTKIDDDINSRRTKPGHYLNLLAMYGGSADAEI